MAAVHARPSGGLVVGLLALVAPGVLGVGYNLVSDALNGQMALKMMLLLLVLKLVATSHKLWLGQRRRHLRTRPLHRRHARRRPWDMSPIS